MINCLYCGRPFITVCNINPCAQRAADEAARQYRYGDAYREEQAKKATGDK